VAEGTPGSRSGCARRVQRHAHAKLPLAAARSPAQREDRPAARPSGIGLSFSPTRAAVSLSLGLAIACTEATGSTAVTSMRPSSSYWLAHSVPGPGLSTAADGQIRSRCVTRPDTVQATLIDRLGLILPKGMRRAGPGK
jgi:hypothetical protein